MIAHGTGGVAVHWLMDQRFDSLLDIYCRHLEGAGETVRAIQYANEFFSRIDRSTVDGTSKFHQRSPEDANRLFMKAWDRERRASTGSGRHLAIGFTSENLEPRERLTIVGAPSGRVAALSDKALQYGWLREAGIPTPDSHACPLAAVPTAVPRLLDAWGAAFVQPTRSAGGELADRIGDSDAATKYIARRGGDGMPPTTPMLLTQFFENATSHSTHGLVTRGGAVHVVATVDLLQNGFRFDGFVFPSFAPAGVVAAGARYAEVAGTALRKLGYWGWYTVDFIAPPNSPPVVTEVNPRFAGESGHLSHLATTNVFDTLLHDAPWKAGQKLNAPYRRLMVTKIRPISGRIAVPPAPISNTMAFLDGKSEQFRETHIDAPLRIGNAHFIGVHGSWTDLNSPPSLLINRYLAERNASHLADKSDMI